MKITRKHGDRSLELERQPMEPERFSALCKLALAAIGGFVLVAVVHMLGLFGLIWSLAGLVAYGGYKLIKGGFID